MRDLLTWIGLALIAVLTTLLTLPFFIDFNDYRPRIAEEISAASGANVALDGPIALRLLPSPRLSVDDAALSGDFGAVKVKNAFFELSLAGLMQGRLQFTQARLDDAIIDLKVGALRRPEMPVLCDHLVLRRARLRLSPLIGPPAQLETLDLDAEILALDGPFHGRGGFDLAGARIAFSFAGEPLTKSALPLKLSLTAPNDLGRLELEGAFKPGVAPLFEGAAKASGKAPPGVWQAEGKASATLVGAALADFSARLGDGPLAEKIAGSLIYGPSGAIALDLTSPEISAGWADFFAGALPLSGGDNRLTARLAIDALDWRGVNWSDVQIALDANGKAHLQTSGPGGLRLDAYATRGGKKIWRGNFDLRVADAAAFLGAASPFRALAATGPFAVDDATLSLSGGQFDLDHTHFAGDLRYRLGRPGKRALLEARLTAPALDLATAPNLAFPFALDADLDLSLKARAGTEGGLAAHILRDGDATRLDQLDLRNFGGADLSAQGQWGAHFAGLKGEARLAARDVSALAQALARFAPGVWTQKLSAAGKALSPVQLAATINGAAATSVAGTLGATRIAANFAPLPDGGQSATLQLTAPEAGDLLAQFGSPVLTGQKLGPAEFTAQGRSAGGAADDYALSAKGDLGRFSGVFSGAWRKGVPSGDLTLAGDPAPLLGGVSAGMLHLSVRMAPQDGGFSFKNLSGQWGDSRFDGELALGAEGFSGALRADHLSLPGLVALVLGPPAPAKAAALWSSLSFAPVLFDPPNAKIAVKTGELSPFGVPAHFDLTLAPGALSLQQADIGNGLVRGQAELRRQGAQATISGEVEAQHAALKNPAFAVTLDGQLRFAGSGASAAALIGSLAGSGAAHLQDLRIEAAAPDGVEAALTQSASSDAPFDAAAVAHMLDQALAKGPLRLEEGDVALRMTEGRLAASREKLDFSFDLRDGGFGLTASVAGPGQPSSDAISADVIWSGPWSAPTRRTDAVSVVNIAAARALEREQARIEKIKAQDRDRLQALEREHAQIEKQKAEDREKLRQLLEPTIPGQ